MDPPGPEIKAAGGGLGVVQCRRPRVRDRVTPTTGTWQPRLMAVTFKAGVAGWDYKNWNGTVYPERPGRGFDKLEYLSLYLPLFEIEPDLLPGRERRRGPQLARAGGASPWRGLRGRGFPSSSSRPARAGPARTWRAPARGSTC